MHITLHHHISTARLRPSKPRAQPFTSLQQQQKPRSLRASMCCAAAQQQLQVFPADYAQAVRQAQDSASAALKAGEKLIEVEFPTSSLSGVSGDAEGANEMSYSLAYLRQFCILFQGNASNTRIFFPDKKERQYAMEGLPLDPKTGTKATAPVFENTAFQLDYLTNPNFLLDFGLEVGKVNVVERVGPSDELFIVAYPHFNVNEVIAIEELYSNCAKASSRPIVVFNGELDRVRSGYYPALFYPKLGQLAKTFIPEFTTAYYIHNFKGSRGGVLFRAYPGPWQVLRRAGDLNSEGLRLVHTQEDMPSLKQVALEILPNT